LPFRWEEKILPMGYQVVLHRVPCTLLPAPLVQVTRCCGPGQQPAMSPRVAVA
jgi:hypothetical protein